MTTLMVHQFYSHSSLPIDEKCQVVDTAFDGGSFWIVLIRHADECACFPQDLQGVA